MCCIVFALFGFRARSETVYRRHLFVGASKASFVLLKMLVVVLGAVSQGVQPVKAYFVLSILF